MKITEEELTKFFEQPGMVNTYRCKNGHEIRTLIGAAGVTPANILCHCGELARSTSYRKKTIRGEKVDAVFLPFAPARFEKDPGTVDHLDRGGLCLHYLDGPGR